MARWAKFVPRKHGEKTAPELVAENRTLIRYCNLMFVGTILSGTALILTGYIERSDIWAATGIFGIAVILQITLLVLVMIVRGSARAAEAFIAISIHTRVPPVFAAGLYVMGTACFAAWVVQMRT
jgi:hypothetical protein